MKSANNLLYVGYFSNHSLEEIEEFLRIEYGFIFADFCDVDLPRKITCKVLPENYTDSNNFLEIPIKHEGKFYTLVINER